MKSLVNLPLLALASAVGHGALIPDDFAQHGRDVSETLLSGAGDGLSAIGDILETDFLKGLENGADPLLEFLGTGDDEEPTQTIYQLMSECPQTSKWAALIKEHDDLVQLLNSTEASHTLFVPTDEAFDRLPFKDRPSEEYIRAALEYHIATDVYTAHDLAKTETVPTVLKEDWLGGKHQRLRAGFDLKGLNINFISKVVKPNIKATNGVIHAIDHVAILPTMVGRELSLLPNVFSTLLLAYDRTDFVKFIHNIKMEGSTVFAPTNNAFAKLGLKANAFLFNTEKGKVILKALLKYQIVANVTLYTDEVYWSDEAPGAESRKHDHFDLVTLLQEKHVAVDVDRFGPFVTMKVNGEGRVIVRDMVAKNGVIQVVDRVPLPPHEHHDGEGEVSVESLVESLWDYVQEDEQASWSNEL